MCNERTSFILYCRQFDNAIKKYRSDYEGARNNIVLYYLRIILYTTAHPIITNLEALYWFNRKIFAHSFLVFLNQYLIKQSLHEQP